MANHIIYVVGDKFKNFACNQDVVTLTEMENMVALPRIGDLPKSLCLIGQGVSLERIQLLRKKIKQNKLEKYFQLEIFDEFLNKEDKSKVHKHNSVNIMLSKPRIIGQSNYESKLLLDDNCVEMSDHVTGQHIQGMILVEAARQMMLAVSENYILNENQQHKFYFVLNNIYTSFKHFAFPLSINVKYEILELERKSNNSIKSNVRISFIQNDVVITQVEISFSAYERVFIESKENSMAIDAINKQRHHDLKTQQEKQDIPLTTRICAGSH